MYQNLSNRRIVLSYICSLEILFIVHNKIYDVTAIDQPKPDWCKRTFVVASGYKPMIGLLLSGLSEMRLKLGLLVSEYFNDNHGVK